MEEARKTAYRLLLAAAMLHLKWDLVCGEAGSLWLRPWRLVEQLCSLRLGACRARVFHNLAELSTRDFDGFEEGRFWEDVSSFQRRFPSDRHNYRELFDRALKGEPTRPTHS